MPTAKFTTPIKKYSVNSDPLTFPISYGPEQFNKIIRNLLKECDIDASSVNFNFFINSELLKVSLKEYIEAKEISEEIKEIVYDIDVEIPVLENETRNEQITLDLKINSKWVATASCELSLIYDITSPEKPVVSIPFDKWVFKVDWVSLNEQTNEAVIIAGGEWNKLSMWKCDLSNGSYNQLFDYKGHLRSITSLSISEDKSLLASGSEDGMFKIWSTSEEVTDLTEETGGIPHVSKKKDKVPTRIPILTVSAHNSSICGIQWLSPTITLPNDVVERDIKSTSGNLITCSNDFYLKLWNINGYESSIVREVKSYTNIKVMDYNRSNGLILTGSSDNRSRCYDLRAQNAETHNVYRAHDNVLTGVKWSPSNSNIYVSTDRSGVTKLWDIRNPKSALNTISQCETSITCCEWKNEWIANSYVDGSLKFYRFSS